MYLGAGGAQQYGRLGVHPPLLNEAWQRKDSLKISEESAARLLLQDLTLCIKNNWPHLMEEAFPMNTRDQNSRHGRIGHRSDHQQSDQPQRQHCQASEQEIIELETDKVNQVLYAPESRRTHSGTSPLDDKVAVGQVIGYDRTPMPRPQPPQRHSSKPAAPAPASAPAAPPTPAPAAPAGRRPFRVQNGPDFIAELKKLQSARRPSRRSPFTSAQNHTPRGDSDPQKNERPAQSDRPAACRSEEQHRHAHHVQRDRHERSHGDPRERKREFSEKI